MMFRECLVRCQRVSAISFLSVLFLSSFVIAQDIEEVIIEAEWNDDSTLDVAESIEAFSLEDLETKQIAGFADVANEVPGLTSSPSGSQGLRFTLRGVGARDSQLGVESKIGLYVDGAFLGRATGLIFDIVDLENVEVWKGPQGFKHGRNAIGGSINMISAKANVDEFSGKLNVSVGNYNSRKVTATINIPITENFAVRASILKNMRDGWVTNNGLGSDFFGYDRDGFRVTARWFASENITFDYAFDQSDSNAEPTYYQMEFLQPGDSAGILTNSTPATRNISAGPFRDPIGASRLDQTTASKEIERGFTESTGHSLVMEWLWSDLHTFKAIATYRETDVVNTFAFFPNLNVDDLQKFSLSGAAGTALDGADGQTSIINLVDQPWLTGFMNISRVGLAGPGSPLWNAFWGPLANDFDAIAFYARDWDGAKQFYAATLGESAPGVGHDPRDSGNTGALNPALLPAFSAADGLQIKNSIDSVFASPPGGTFGLRDHSQFSIELQQTGYWLDERLEYHSGLYYFKERTGNGTSLPEGSYDELGLPVGNVFYSDLIEFLDFGGINSKDIEVFGYSFISFNRLTTDATGVYFNLKYTPLKWDERLHISGGLRYSKDDRKLRRQGLQALTLLPRGQKLRASATWESVDPYIKAEYDISDDAIGYVSVTRGFRGGNFNVLSRDRDGLEFKAEKMIAYEAGMKGSFFGVWEVETAVFYYDIKDGQETVIDRAAPLVRNVVNADGFARGFEFNNKFFLTDEWTFSADYAFLNSGSESYQRPDIDVRDPAKLAANINESDAFIRECTGGLLVADFNTGRCNERKSNFGAPENSWSTTLEYKLPTDFGHFKTTLSYNYKDGHFVNDTLQVDARNIWNLRVSTQLEMDTSTMRVALWSQNLFDHEYQVEKFELNGFVYDLAAYGPPRTVGIDFIYEWF